MCVGVRSYEQRTNFTVFSEFQRMQSNHGGRIPGTFKAQVEMSPKLPLTLPVMVATARIR